MPPESYSQCSRDILMPPGRMGSRSGDQYVKRFSIRGTKYLLCGTGAHRLYGRSVSGNNTMCGAEGTMLRRVLGLVSLLVFCGTSLIAQVTTGTISGTVKDNSGAVLPSATVEVRNVDTGSSRNAAADARGYFSATNLPVGQYEVTAGMTGFQTSVRRGITLNVGQNAVLDFTLQVGAMTEKVEVTAEAPLVETNTATVS